MIFVNPVVLATSILCVHAADEFNFGYQTSIQKGFEHLFTLPWISSNCMSSAMNSDFPIIDSWAAENGDDHFGIDDNMTTGYLWTLFKEIDENINGIYYGFENGKCIMYNKVSMLPMLSYVKSKDSSCLAHNIQKNCMLEYSGSDLDSETGRSSSGHRTGVVNYDPTKRPWYISSKDDSSVKWSDIYLDFHSDALCITAVQQVWTISGTFIGVIGIDFMFTQLESYLKSASIQAFVVEGSPNVDGNHNLVASSVQNVTVDEYGRQIPAQECEDEWIAAVSRYIETDLGGYFEASKHEAVISMRHSTTETLWVKSSQLNIDGIDWYMVFIEPVDCLEGYALEKYNSSYCGKCVSPATSSGGNSICDECVPGYYYNTEDEKCVACPDGAHCYGGASLPAPRSGHWADTDKLEYLMQNEASFPPCKIDESCPGVGIQDHVWETCFKKPAFLVNCTREKLCAHGSRGVLCDGCKEKFYHDGWQCIGCVNAVGSIQNAILMGLLVLLMASIFILKRARLNLEESSRHLNRSRIAYATMKTKLKITVSFLQIVTKFPGQFEVDYPREFLHMCHYIAVYASLSVSTSCWVYIDRNVYFWELLAKTLAPLALSGLGYTYYLTRRFLCKLSGAELKRFESSMMFWFLFFTYVIFAPCSTIVLNTFECETMASGNTFMHMDYTTQCQTYRHELMRIYAGVFIFIYPLGIPTMYFVLLYRRRDEIDPMVPGFDKKPRMSTNPDGVRAAAALRDENHRLQPLSFLFESYEPQFWWWELVVCLERLLLTNANIYMSHYLDLRPFVLLTISLFMVKLYSQLDPYIVDSDDLFGEIVQWNKVALILVTIIFQLEIETQSSVMGVAINGLLLFIIGILAYFCLATVKTEIAIFREFHSAEKWTKKMRRSSFSTNLSRVRSFIFTPHTKEVPHDAKFKSAEIENERYDSPKSGDGLIRTSSLDNSNIAVDQRSENKTSLDSTLDNSGIASDDQSEDNVDGSDPRSLNKEESIFDYMCVVP